MPATSGPPPAAVKASRGNKLQQWIRTHKAQAAVGAGAVGAVGIALVRRHNAEGSAATDPAAASDIASAGGIPGSYAPYSGGGDGTGGGGYYGGVGDAGTPSGADATGLLNGLANFVGAMPQQNEGDVLAGVADLISVISPPSVAGSAPPAARPVKKTPTKTITVRKIKKNPPGRHNTTVKKVRTVRISKPAPKPDHKHRKHKK